MLEAMPIVGRRVAQNPAVVEISKGSLVKLVVLVNICVLFYVLINRRLVLVSQL